MAENNIDDIDKEISFLEQKLQEFKSESFNIRNTSSMTHTDKDSVKIAKEAQREKKPRDSGFMSGTSYVEFYSDEDPKPHTNAKVSWEDEHTQGAKSSVNFNDDNFISTPILRSTPESNITRRRKAGSSNAFQIDEGLSMNRMSDRKSPTYIKPATFDGTGSWLDYRSHFDACAMLNNWTQREMGLYLAVSLRGQAQGVLGNLTSTHKHDYNLLVNSLEDRFAPSNQNDLY